MTLPAKSSITPEEYLALEHRAEFRSEYFNGEIFAMAGGSPEHDRITDDFMADVNRQVEGGPCETFTSNMRVKVSPTGLYTYPDGSVACGEALFDGEAVKSLLNPVMILEVLSSSTEAYDRGGKFAHYKTIPSLIYYVLVTPDRPRVEVFMRQTDEDWLYREITGMEGNVDLTEIGCHLPMSRIYRRITFPPELSLHEDRSDHL